MWAAQLHVVEGLALYVALGLYVVAMLGAAWRTRRAVFLALTLLPLLPLVLVAGLTVQEYRQGTVRVPGFPLGMKSLRESDNLDRQLRVQGGERNENILPWTMPLARTRRRTLELLVDRFGPVPGSYQGPYPERDLAYAVARAAYVFVTPAALSQPLVVDGVSIVLQPRDLQRIFGWGLPPEDAERPPVALKMFEGTCLLVGLWSGGYYHVEMIDASGHGWFARYVYPPDEG